jgi:hypothetical protein
VFGSNSNVAYAGGWGSGIRYSSDGGFTWSARNNGLFNTVVKAIVVSPADDAIVFAGAEDGVYRSVNGGVDWTLVRSGLNVSAIAFAQTDPSRMYLGTWGAGMWVSTDSGLSWAPLEADGLPITGDCQSVATDPGDDSIVYATFQGGGVWLTLDGGVSWRQITPGFEGFGVALDPARPGFVYGVGGWTTPKRSGCYGATYGWRGMDAGWNPSWFARGIAVDPGVPGRIYACGATGGLFRWDSDVAPPEPATDLVAGASGGRIALTWEPSPSIDCAGYWVYRWELGGSPAITPLAWVIGGLSSSYHDTAVEAGTTFVYAVAAVDQAENAGGLSNEASASVSLSFDLDVLFISRLPHDTHAYRVQYPAGVPFLEPGTENDKRWPALGETVTFVAHIKNKGTATTPSCGYRWTVNGAIIQAGVLPPVGPRLTDTVTLDWIWNVAETGPDHSDQVVTFEVDYDNQIVESFEQNNNLSDYIEAMSIDIYVDQAIYDAFDTVVTLAATYGFDNWIQAQFDAMNQNFARSVYPLAPNGCLERIRIDRIIIGPAPAEAEGAADGRWQFTGDPGYVWFADKVDGGLIHELMHQLGIIDLYQMPVSPTHNRVVTPDGFPVNLGFGFGRPGIMAGGDIYPHAPGASQFMPEFCSSHDVLALNRNVGYRRGYYGEYMFDVPSENRVLVRDSSGAPAAGVTVRVFQGGGGSMDAVPVTEGTTDAEGIYVLTNRVPVQSTTTATGHTLAANPFGTINVVGVNATLLLEFSRPNGDFDYHFLNMIEFNEAVWGGQTQQWTKEVDTRLSGNALPRIGLINSALEQSSIRLVWNEIPGAVAYRVYRASRALNRPEDPNQEYENYVFRPLATVTGLEFTDVTRYETSLYAVAPLAADQSEGPLSVRVFAPQLLNPWAVAVLPNGERVVLDPQNGFAFLRQTAFGAFISNTGSEHNHVEFSRFIAIDASLHRMLTSHPSDWYGGPHSIRVTDLEGTLDGLFDIGVFGAAPGQFNDPAGVAVDAQSRIYVVDRGNSRVQVLNSNGDFLAQLGGSGSGPGQFASPEGVAVGPNLDVYVCDRGNHRVQILRFDPVGNALSHMGALSGLAFSEPVGIAVGPTGAIYVSDHGRESVEEFDPAGQWVQTHAAALFPASGSFSNPSGLVVDARGRVIVCDTGNRRVVLAHAPPIMGDINGDHYVNAADMPSFVTCLNGPAVAPPLGCSLADLDVDADVDLLDFANLQRMVD